MSENIDLKTEISNKFALQIKLLGEFNKSIHANVFRINLKALRDNSTIVDFNNSRWERDPYKFCYDHYNVIEYYKLILLVNNCKTMFAFSSESLNRKIIAPSVQIVDAISTYSNY